jgi:SAM-dependent methyltransferase
MNGQKDEVFTGNLGRGNPFEGDLSAAIGYDTVEAYKPMVEDNGAGSVISNNYRYVARRLIRHFPSLPDQRVLDLGSGTGISTLELLCQHPSLTVVGVEIAPGPFSLANYKFHKDPTDIVKDVTDPTLQSYWDKFRKESEPFQELVTFVNKDFGDKKLTESYPFTEKFDGAIGNQYIHNASISQSLWQLKDILKPGAPFLWNSASHFCYDGKVKPKDFGFRYNDFFKVVLDVVNKTFPTRDLSEQPNAAYSIGHIKRMTEGYGFKTMHCATYLVYFDLRTIIQHHVLPITKSLMKEKIDSERADPVIRHAIGEAIQNPAALSDIQHTYDIVPVFCSRYSG